MALMYILFVVFVKIGDVMSLDPLTPSAFGLGGFLWRWAKGWNDLRLESRERGHQLGCAGKVTSRCFENGSFTAFDGCRSQKVSFTMR